MLYLASASPRRKELLSLITLDFQIEVPAVNERLIDDFLLPERLSYEEARLKAYAVFAKHPSDMVLAADTIVLLDGKVLGKPGDAKHAKAMLKEESGKKQVVLTSYTFVKPSVEISRTVKSVVYFNHLTDEMIDHYIKVYRPFDKAGGYGIQDEAGLIDHIEGSYHNVMGLPTEDLMRHVKPYL
jgi:septum formation protein